MRARLTVLLVVSMALAACVLFASTPLAAQGRPPAQELRDVLPPSPKADQFVLTRDGRRTYFTNAAGELWLFDRGSKAVTLLQQAGPGMLQVRYGMRALAMKPPPTLVSLRAPAAEGVARVWLG